MGGDKPLFWMGSTRRNIKGLPEDVKDVFGFALRHAQKGGKHPDAKPLSGYKGTKVLEVVEDYDTNTYRAVYTVKFADAVYVLHVFMKKSKKGKATPRGDLDLIERRLKEAEAHYADWTKKQNS